MGYPTHFSAILDYNSNSDLFLVTVCAVIGLWCTRRVHSSLHAPLMSLTNAMSSIVCFLAISIYSKIHKIEASSGWPRMLLLAAIFLLVINAVGGLLITHRMLKQFTPSSSS